MITEAEIQSIDYASNSCVVRIPFFETLNTMQDVVLPSRFAIQPGIYSGYKIGDVVWVAFEDGQAKNPIIIGKVFKGTSDEANSGGAINCSSLSVSKTATIPDSTTIQTSDSNFDSIKKIIEKIKNLQIACGFETDENGDTDKTGVVGTSYVLLIRAFVGGSDNYIWLSVKVNKAYDDIDTFIETTYKYCNNYDKFIPLCGSASGDWLGIFAREDTETGDLQLWITPGYDEGCLVLGDPQIEKCYSVKEI